MELKAGVVSGKRSDRLLKEDIMNTKGEHVMMDIWFEESLPNNIKETINNILLKHNVKVVDYLGHSFNPHGETLVWILAASSLTIHTYPEEKYTSIDIYTCDGEGSALAISNSIVEEYILNIESIKHSTTNRGIKPSNVVKFPSSQK